MARLVTAIAGLEQRFADGCAPSELAGDIAALLPAGSPMNDSVATAGLKSDFLAGIQDEDEEPAGWLS